jgi:MarR family transcriptional regulator, organic hydroperoxide resistance regulator
VSRKDAAPSGASGAAAVTAGPGESPGFLLWRVTLRWQRLMVAALRPLDLTHVQFVLLASTWWLTEVAGERPTQRRLADHAGTDPMMASQVLRALELKGLLIREPDPVDGRARRLAVTRAGAALARKAITVVEAADAEFFAAAPDRVAVLDALRALSG